MFDMNDYYNDCSYESNENVNVAVAKCVHCGKGIFQPDEAMVINASNNTIHIGCWEDYAAENYEEFLSEFYG